MSLDDFLSQAPPKPKAAPAPFILARGDFNSFLACLYADARYTLEPPFIKVLHFENGSDRSEFIRRFHNFSSKYGAPPKMVGTVLPHRDIKTKCAVGFHKETEVEALLYALHAAQA